MMCKCLCIVEFTYKCKGVYGIWILDKAFKKKTDTEKKK